MEIWREDGFVALLRSTSSFIYRRLHPKYLYLNYVRDKTSIDPDIETELNDVVVHFHRSLDRYVPGGWIPMPPKPFDDFESGAVEALETVVQAGDTVVIVGGGKGVTATHAAWNGGPSGKVIVYEGAANFVEVLSDTVETNGVGDRVEIHHAIVGANGQRTLMGPAGSANVVHPNMLPECQVLEMDCEGSETEILRDMSIRPEHLVIETHGNRDEIRRILDGMGYEVQCEKIADRRLSQEQVEKWGLYTIVAKKE